MRKGMSQRTGRGIRDHSEANPLLCWMVFPPWRPFLVRRRYHLSIRLASLLNKTFRNSQLSINLTDLSHDSSLPTIGRNRLIQNAWCQTGDVTADHLTQFTKVATAHKNKHTAQGVRDLKNNRILDDWEEFPSGSWKTFQYALYGHKYCLSSGRTNGRLTPEANYRAISYIRHIINAPLNCHDQ